MPLLSDQDVQNILSSAVKDITIETTLTPAMTLQVADVTQGPPNPVVDFLKPTVTFDTPAGPFTLAPYGRASGISGSVETWGIIAGVGLAAIVGLSMWAGARLVR